jgi:hypothetical protein
MTNELIAALVGAFAGSIGGGLTSWLLLRRQIASARNWETATQISEIAGPILSAYTPDRLETKEDVFRLQQAWGEMSRSLGLLGLQQAESGIGELDQAINDYFRALVAYVQKEMTRGELEHRRVRCKSLIRVEIRVLLR